MAEFQEPLQKGTNAIHRLNRFRIHLGKNGNGGNVQPQVPVPSGTAYYVHCSYDDSLCMYRFHRDKDCVAWFAEELRGLNRKIYFIC